MPCRSTTLRLTALATASALALTTATPAWSAPPPIGPQGDPPSRVARLSRINGTVSYHTANADHWSPASLNYPASGGDAFWTEPGARLDLQLAVNRLTLAPQTELDVTGLDDRALATSEPQGETYLELRQVPSGDSYTVLTPRGTVQITASGRYDVVAGDTTHPTVVTVVDGAAQVTGPNLSLQVGPRQTATITGTDTLQGSIGPVSQDAFLTAMLAEDRPAPRATVAIPPIVQGMTGAEDLYDDGSWQDVPQYGTVWYPPVQAGWVPYRQGHWAYVAPWGWTWVDNASWGFAPFHYGRWVEVDNRWGWVPVTPGAVPVGPVPVYAPALVSFIDLGGATVAGAAVGFAAGALAGRSIGWVPLGPREPYYPPYRTNLAYVRNLNAPAIQNVDRSIATVNVVNNRTVVNNFINRGAATVVPAATMLRSSPIDASIARVAPGQLATARTQFRMPFSPGPQTAGVTPAVARQFNFIPPSRPAQPLPGPAIERAVQRPAVAGRPALPALRPVAGEPGAARVGEPGAPFVPGRPGEPVARPGQPGAPVAEPGRPGASAIEPARPGEPAARQGQPGVPAAEPGRPGATGIEPGRPGEPVARPAQPGAPGAEPGRPGTPRIEPARPTEPAAGPQTPALEPGRPVPAPRSAERAAPPAAPHGPAPEPERRAVQPIAPRPEARAAPEVARPQAPPAPRPMPAARPQAAPAFRAPPPRPAAPPPRPAAPPPRPAAAPHPAAPPRPAPREEHRP